MTEDDKSKAEFIEELRQARQLIAELKGDDCARAREADALLSEEYIDSLPGLFYVFDNDRFIKWNTQWHRVTGFSDEELAVRYGTDFFDGEDQVHIGERMAKVFRDGAADARADLITKDGRRIPYYFTGVRRTFHGKEHLVGLGIDITKQKQIEEEKLSLERQVQQAQKLESLGVLAGGIAHDFNNLLMAILGNVDVALGQLALGTPARESVRDIETAAQRAAELTKQMLAYSGKGRFDTRKIDLETLVREMVHLLEVSISKMVAIEYHFSPDVPPVEGDPSQLRQIVMNLVINASEAIGNQSGVISLRTGAMQCDRAYFDDTHFDNDLPDGVYSYFEVTDTGAGMDAATIDKMFDPFFSTKFTGRGLGLAAVLGIVRGHRGALKVVSRPGRGATFRVLFPASQATALSYEACERAASYSALEKKRVLLVDDDAAVRSVGRRLLERLGVVVSTAEDGRAALTLFQQDPEQFDCIILDLTMPNLDGEETFREMRRIHGEVSVLLSSGYGEDELIARFSGKGLAGFLQKPYQTNDIADALVKVFRNER